VYTTEKEKNCRTRDEKSNVTADRAVSSRFKV